ncbi:POTRA domain-containing protein [Pseudomonas sp. CBSPBW29]|nr:POTRA domain-containing protein [Pseudomonas sp. CBSPBW29]
MNARHLALTALAVWTLFTTAAAQAAGPEEELLRQQERERALRDQLESRPDVRLQAPALDEGGSRLPVKEAPCFAIKDIRLIGDASEKFQWALKAANPEDDPAVGRCLGGAGINMTMKRMQNAIIQEVCHHPRACRSAGPQQRDSGADNRAGAHP